MPRPLIGQQLRAGERAAGVLVYPMPARTPGSLLVYRFGDAPAGDHVASPARPLCR